MPAFFDPNRRLYPAAGRLIRQAAQISLDLFKVLVPLIILTKILAERRPPRSPLSA
ncbi:MAG: hypothetical protein JXR37_31040 [Kiritimatiellae bacterium]|nr:hypothetical protein [Kiritimatiellia bacterium]